MSFPPALQQRALALSQPLAVYLELTYRCNWRCVFCYNPRHFDIRGLDVSAWQSVLDDLRSLGTLYVNLTGGEPLAHPQFFEIAELARQRKFAVRLLTNGSMIGPVEARRIARIRFSSVDMSLHGGTAEIHDRTTGRPGSFDALWSAVRLLKTERVPVVVKTPLTRLNEHELDEMIDLAQKNDVEYKLDYVITPRDDGDLSPLELSASPAAIARVIGMVDAGDPSARVPGGVNCGLGRTTMAIDPEGNVFPCIQWRHRSLGNVVQTRLIDLWKSSTVRTEAARTALDANTMLLEQSQDLQLAGFCPALAYQRAGDPMSMDRVFLENAQLLAQARGSHE